MEVSDNTSHTSSSAARLRRLAKNPRLLFWSRAFYETKVLNSIVTVFYLQRGLTLDQVLFMTIVWSVVAIAAEVPTGYIADRYGRRLSLIIGYWIFVFSTLWLIIAHGVWMIGIGFALASLSFAFLSGTDEALLYDTLKELKREGDATRIYGMYQSAKNIFKAFLPLIGAFVASDLLPWQFTILLIADALLTIVGLWFLLKVEEPARYTSLVEHEKNILRTSIIGIWRDPLLLRLALNKALGFIAIMLVWRVYQPVLVEQGIPIVWLGIFYFVYHGSAFLLRNQTHRLAVRFGEERLGNITMLLPAVFVLAMFFTRNGWALFTLLYFTFLFQSVREPLFLGMMHSRIASFHRAITISNFNMLRNILDIPIFFSQVCLRHGMALMAHLQSVRRLRCSVAASCGYGMAKAVEMSRVAQLMFSFPNVQAASLCAKLFTELCSPCDF